MAFFAELFNELNIFNKLNKLINVDSVLTKCEEIKKTDGMLGVYKEMFRT